MVALKLRLEIIGLLLIVLTAAVLRFYHLGSNPPGLYWDETVFGYDAYSILKTAHDHHGNFMPLFFESFGDWKLPVYHYLLVPSVAIFGLSEFAVRFPSALLGTLTVFIFFLLVRNLTKNLNLSLLATFFLAISPWHIQFSRGGFESTAGLFFLVSGIFLFLVALEKNKLFLFTYSFLLFTLSMYSYHAYRIFTPLIVITQLAIFFPKIKNKIRQVLPGAVISIIFLIPLALFTASAQGRARAISQSAFKPEEVEARRIGYDQMSKKPLRNLSKYLFPGPIYYTYLAAKGYADHFSPTFLFTRGDQIGRHSQVDMGQVHIFEALLIGFGIFAIKTLKPDAKKLMLAFLLLAPIPATIVLPTPHAYRTLQMSVPLAFLSGLGAYFLATSIKPNIIKIGILGFCLYFFATYLHLLFIHYPIKFGHDWQEGYRELVNQIKMHQNNYEKVYVTNIDQVPYIYLLFYQKYDPRKFFENQGNSKYFDKYAFVSPDDDSKYHNGTVLYAAPSWEKVDGKWLSAVNDSAGKHLFSLWEVYERQ